MGFLNYNRSLVRDVIGCACRTYDGNGLDDGQSRAESRAMEGADVLLLMKDQQKYCYVTIIQHQDILLECTKVRIIINNNTERESVCCLCNSVLFCWVVQFMTGGMRK